MKVSDIMTREVITVTKDTSLKEAAGILAKFRIHGMPVVDGENKVVGILTESDFFAKDSSNIYLPTFIDFINGGKVDAQKLENGVELERKTTVNDIMTEECFTVPIDLPVEKLIQMFKDKSFNSVPVVDEMGRITGIVTIMDVIKLL